MIRFPTLVAATLALTATACGPGERFPAAPETIASANPPVYVPSGAPLYRPVQAQTIYRAPQAPLPYSRANAVPAAPVTIRPQPVQTAYTSPVYVPRQSTPYVAPQATAPIAPLATPKPVQIASAAPLAATRGTTSLRTTPARPPARTEMERLNPGMPRLVGPSPRSETSTARPRTKPSRTAPRGHGGAHSGFSIPNTPTSTSYTSSMSTPPSIEYSIPHIPQEEPLWCWAAAAQQAIGWVNNGRAPAQCAIVALAHDIDINKCCNDREGVCAKTGEIPAIAKLIRRFGGQAAETASVPRDPQEVYDILKTGATLLIRIRPAPNDAAVGIRHMIVVRGIEWTPLPNGQLEATLFYNDPLGEGYRAVSFDEIEGFFEQALIVRRST